MQINDAGLCLIKQFEGCRLTAYKDVVGIWTIGYGATGPEIVEGLEWTQDQADERLLADLTRFEDGVDDLVTTSLSSNQFSALVCFSYNVGLGNLKSSLLLRCINTNHFDDAATQFVRWDKAGGVVVQGLLNRRIAERNLFILSA